MRVYVTQRDIARARKLLPLSSSPEDRTTKCPVALATGRATHRKARVDMFVMRLGKNKKTAVMPEAARDFVRRFDESFPTERLEPFSFVLPRTL